jgi:hypothetical protein
VNTRIIQMKARRKKSTKPDSTTEALLLPSASKDAESAPKPESERWGIGGYIVPFRRVIE